MCAPTALRCLSFQVLHNTLLRPLWWLLRNHCSSQKPIPGSHTSYVCYVVSSPPLRLIQLQSGPTDAVNTNVTLNFPFGNKKFELKCMMLLPPHSKYLGISFGLQRTFTEDMMPGKAFTLEFCTYSCTYVLTGPIGVHTVCVRTGPIGVHTVCVHTGPIGVHTVCVHTGPIGVHTVCVHTGPIGVHTVCVHTGPIGVHTVCVHTGPAKSPALYAPYANSNQVNLSNFPKLKFVMTPTTHVE